MAPIITLIAQTTVIGAIDRAGMLVNPSKWSWCFTNEITCGVLLYFASLNTIKHLDGSTTMSWYPCGPRKPWNFSNSWNPQGCLGTPASRCTSLANRSWMGLPLDSDTGSHCPPSHSSSQWPWRNRGCLYFGWSQHTSFSWPISPTHGGQVWLFSPVLSSTTQLFHKGEFYLKAISLGVHDLSWIQFFG